MRTVEFYRTTSGDCPVASFLDNLQPKAAQKVVWVLKLIEELDRVPASYFKKLMGTDDIWEVRVDHGSDTYRLLCFMAVGKVVVLTHGFIKKTQKTPAQEIVRAERYKADWLQRSAQ